jgi:hypothetical protein
MHRRDNHRSTSEIGGGDTELQRRSIATPSVISDQNGLRHGAIVSARTRSG